MGTSLRDGSELLSLPLHPILICEHDEHHALKAHAVIIITVSSKIVCLRSSLPDAGATTAR